MSNCIPENLRSFRSLILFLALPLWFGLLPGVSLSAQVNNQPYFRNYSTDDGLPSPEVHDILQDRKGYMWIATDTGVSRFDGYQFKNYGADNGLKNNVVFHLQEDSLGRIWMQTMSGNLYYYHQDSIHSYPYNHLINYYQNYFRIPNDFLFGKDGTLYTALYGIGVLKISPDGQSELINLCHYNDIIILESPGSGRYLYSIVQNTSLIYLGWNKSRKKYKPQMGIYADTLKQSYILPRNPGFTSMYGYIDEHIMIFDIRNELNVYTRDTLKASAKLPTSVAEITRINDNFWIGFNDRMGVRFYEDQGDVLVDDYQVYLAGESISAICRDRLGGYWFGSLNSGIFYTPNLNLQVLHREKPGTKEKVLALENWRDDQLLFSTDIGTVYRLDSKGEIQKFFETSGAVFDLWYERKKDRVWIAGIPLQVFDGEKVKIIKHAPELKTPNWVVEKKLSPFEEQEILYGSSGYGLDIIDLNREFVVYSTVNAPIKERLLDVFVDFSGRIWIANTRGLFQFKDSALVAPQIDHPVFRLRIEDIDQLSDSTLVIGTKGGGVVLWKNDQLIIIDESKGLNTNMIENITLDTLQQIWVGTLNGLSKLSKNEQTNIWQVKNFSMAHGLPSNEINDICALGKWVYVGTSKGLIKLPLVDTSETVTPNLFLEKILVNGQNKKLDDRLTLKFRERNLQLTFLCVNYKFDGNIQYRYRLSSKTAWSYTYDRSVNYAALAPGKYLFEVQAQNENGDWSESLCRSFSISSPVWQRWWFILLSAASFVGLVYYWYRLRVFRLQKEAGIEREINELQRSALQAQMNPHFIFNCLNSIQSFIASGKKASAMEYLSRFAALVRTTLNASVASSITLQDEVQVLENYLELEKLRFGKRFEYQIHVDPRLDPFDTMLPPLLVQPFVENAIIHGFNFADKSRAGQIFIAYELLDDLLQITIRDNGIGIERSQLDKAGKERLRTSLGMNITRKRLSLQTQDQDQDFLMIRALTDPEGNTCGTEITIAIKF